MIDNAVLLAECLKEQYGKEEFTESQIFEAVDEFLDFGDPTTAKKYLEYCLRKGQIEQQESGFFKATPHQPLTPRQKLARLRAKNIKQ